MSPLRKLELAWKFRRPLWKYRKLIRYRKEILVAVVVVAVCCGVGFSLRGTSSPAVDCQS